MAKPLGMKQRPRESYTYVTDSTHFILRQERKVIYFRAGIFIWGTCVWFQKVCELPEMIYGHFLKSKKFHCFQKSPTPPKKLRTAALEQPASQPTNQERKRRKGGKKKRREGAREGGKEEEGEGRRKD